jgi:hypothetical protein
MKLSQKLKRHSIAVVGLEICSKNNTITLECFIGRSNTNHQQSKSANTENNRVIQKVCMFRLKMAYFLTGW